MPDLLGAALYFRAQPRARRARCARPYAEFFCLSDRTQNLRARRSRERQVPILSAGLTEEFSRARLRPRANAEARWRTRFSAFGRRARGSGRITFPDTLRLRRTGQ